eukprot:PhM_4_TR7011/c0_g1_i1/m.30307
MNLFVKNNMMLYILVLLSVVVVITVNGVRVPLPFCSNETKPEIVIAVVPGGAYMNVAAGHEGRDICFTLFKEHNLCCYVIDYTTRPRRHEQPRKDLNEALLRVSAAHPWRRIVLVGFSAGGHLVGTFLVHDYSNEEAPQYVIGATALIYPVVSFDPAITHAGSVRALLYASATQDSSSLRGYYSVEKHVSECWPRNTFLLHSVDDPVVPLNNTLVLNEALRRVGVVPEMHIYEHGRHGFGWGKRLKVNAGNVRSWRLSFVKWLS